MGALSIDVVICTYNRSASLDATLASLAAMRVTPSTAWVVTVVDNNSTDDTAAVVERHVRQGRIPGLRRVVAAELGLTPARLAGARRSEADWIAFVDDDCVVDPDWVQNAAAFLAERPACGALASQIGRAHV